MQPTLFFRLGDKDEISLADLAKAFRTISTLLADFDAAVSQDRRGTVRWEVSVLSKNSPPLLGVTGRPVQRRHRREPVVDNVARIETEVLSSVEMLSRASERSATLSDALMQRVRSLAVQSKRIGAIQVYNEAQKAPIDTETLETIKTLTGKNHVSYGSVTGSLDTIAVHNANEIRIWDESTNRPVRCRYPMDYEDRIKGLLRQRVEVAGQVAYNPFGQAVSVEVETIESAIPVASLPTIEQMSGLLDDATGGLSLAEYLGRLRDE